jgi:hypothetical protein
MKYICLGYIEEKKWETMSESERNAMMEECFAQSGNPDDLPHDLKARDHRQEHRRSFSRSSSWQYISQRLLKVPPKLLPQDLRSFFVRRRPQPDQEAVHSQGAESEICLILPV